MTQAPLTQAQISKIQKGFGFEYVVLTETRFGKLTLHFDSINKLIDYLNTSGCTVAWGTWE